MWLVLPLTQVKTAERQQRTQLASLGVSLSRLVVTGSGYTKGSALRLLRSADRVLVVR